MTKTSDERREFFRIDDSICLKIDTISEAEFNAAPDFLANLHNNSFSLSADFATLNNKLHPVLNNIKQLHPEIAQYLELLNTKIDSLSEHLLIESGTYDENKRIQANLSASGIMLESASKYNINDLVKLEIILFPEKIGVLIFGKIVKASNTDNNHQTLSIVFEHIRDEDQELMIKHNLGKQMSELRVKNDND